jgi:demethylmenaquinone methyltransferase/2-methoxy-6-polyprenyl-1,4-benzoquinol methylase
MRYYWHTINECVSPDTVLDVLTSTGFVGVERRLRGGLLSEYIGLKPAR